MSAPATATASATCGLLGSGKAQRIVEKLNVTQIGAGGLLEWGWMHTFLHPHPHPSNRRCTHYSIKGQSCFELDRREHFQDLFDTAERWSGTTKYYFRIFVDHLDPIRYLKLWIRFGKEKVVYGLSVSLTFLSSSHRRTFWCLFFLLFRNVWLKEWGKVLRHVPVDVSVQSKHSIMHEKRFINSYLCWHCPSHMVTTEAERNVKTLWVFGRELWLLIKWLHESILRLMWE